MRRLLPAAMAGLCAVVLGVTACSSHSNSSGGSSSGTSSAAVQGISGDTIKVGGLFEATDDAGAQAGFNARITRANKDGELGKYKIQLVTMDDDAESPATDLTDAESLVEQKGVYAVAPVESPAFSSSTAAFLQQKGIPYFGAGFTNGFCQPYDGGLSQIGCGVGGSYVSSNDASEVAHALGKPVNKLKWAFVGTDIPTGTQADNSYADTVKLDGGDVVYNQAVVPLDTGNMAPIVNAVEATHPDVIWFVGGSQGIAVKTAFKSSGFTGALVDSSSYSPGLLKESPAVAAALNGTYVFATLPVIEQQTPFVQQMVKDYQATGLSTADITFGGEYAYMIADDMIALLKKIAPNFGAVQSTLKSGFSYTPASGGAPVSYPFMFNGSVDCSSVLKIENGVYDTATNYACTRSYIDLSGATPSVVEEPGVPT